MTQDRADELTLSQIAPLVNLSANYLRAAAIRRDLPARKRGRNWVTTLADVRSWQQRDLVTSQAEGRRRKWDVDKMVTFLRDQMHLPVHERAFNIPADMLVPLSLRFAQQWARDQRDGTVGATLDAERKAYIEMTLGQHQMIKASRFFPQMRNIAHEMAASRDQGLEITVESNGPTQIVMTQHRYDQYIAILTKHLDQSTDTHAVKGAQDASALLITAPAQSTFFTIDSVSDQPPVRLVAVTADVHDQLSRHLSWEIEQWFRELMVHM